MGCFGGKEAKKIIIGVSVFFATLFLTGCDTEPNFAPVTEINTIEPIPKTGIHQVKKGETLYEIAWRYGQDYRYLATRNQMHAPYQTQAGQPIYLRGQSVAAPKIQPQPKLSNKNVLQENQMPRVNRREPNYQISKWLWPAHGKVINAFSRTHKGINIASYAGEIIYAAGPGKVVYVGDGLRGYGNLIIIKHNSLYLSAYAHNNIVFVKEGAWVKQGQKIAEMGNTGADKVMLHFEIRRAGKPIDPLILLN